MSRGLGGRDNKGQPIQDGAAFLRDVVSIVFVKRKLVLRWRMSNSTSQLFYGFPSTKFKPNFHHDCHQPERAASIVPSVKCAASITGHWARKMARLRYNCSHGAVSRIPIEASLHSQLRLLFHTPFSQPQTDAEFRDRTFRSTHFKREAGRAKASYLKGQQKYSLSRYELKVNTATALTTK